jgi:hypothetical protein
MECAKENKKSFFRKGGKSQGYYSQPQGQLQQHQMLQGQSQPRTQQRSFDNMSSTPSSSSSSYGRAPAQSPSISSIDFDSLSLASSASSKKTIHSLQSLQSLQLQSQNLQNLQSIQALQSLQNLHNLQNLQHQQQQQIMLQQQQQQQRPPAPLQLPQKHAQKQQQLQHQLMGRVGPIPGNSGSLDEAEINMNAHRRYMPAPRRARSAERFDGMRIQQIQGAGVGSGTQFYTQTKVLLEKKEEKTKVNLNEGEIRTLDFYRSNFHSLGANCTN